MLESALLCSRPSVRAHALRRSLPTMVALHGAVLGGVIAANVWGAGEPPPPADPIVFGTFASPPPPRGQDGTVSPQPHHASSTRSSEIPRIDRVPDTTSADDQPSRTDDPPALDGIAGGPDDGLGAPGSPDGIDGGTGTIHRPIALPGEDEPITPGGDVSYPLLMHRVEPDYPEAARRAHIQGVVILEAIVTGAGGVEDVRVVRSANPLLDESAARAVRQWGYRPATLNGRAVRVRLTVTVTFSLPSG